MSIPPLIERVSGNEGWNADDNSLSPAHNVITGNDNIDYITINALAKRSGMSVHQLRRLDKQGGMLILIVIQAYGFLRRGICRIGCFQPVCEFFVNVVRK